MGSIAQRKVSPLAAGFYSVPEAARLIEVGDARRIYGWLRGYPNSAVGPLIRRDFRPLGHGDEELSFLDLMEVRAIEYFRDNGVKARTLRVAIEEARKVLETEHPFASKHISFKADEKYVYLDDLLKKAAKDERDSLLYNLITKRYESFTLIRETIGRGVTFNPTSGLANQWIPRDGFPKITINPRISFGKPALPSGIGTITLFDAWKAEGENYDEVAYWFEIPANDVRQAVEFELQLAKAA